MDVQGHNAHQRLAPVFGRQHPGGFLAVLQPVGQAEIQPVPHQVLPALEVPDLLPDGGLVLLRDQIQIQLIAEGARHRHHSAGVDGRHAARLLVGRNGYMRAHAVYRIAEGCAVLNPDAFDSIGHVAAPDLRSVVEHACVKASAAPGAALDQHRGVARAQPLHEIIHAQHIFVQYFSLTLMLHGGGIHIVDGAVHVHFDVVDAAAVQHAEELAADVVHHLPAGEVQHQLITAADGLLAGDDERPVRVLLEQVGGHVHHFRLDPQPEAHAQRLDPRRQLTHAAAQLGFVHPPVAQSVMVAGAPAEPAVVQHHHVHAQLGGLLGNLHDFLPGEVHVGGFPVVDQHGAFLPLPGVADDMAADELMEALAQVGQAAVSEHHHGFRRGENLAGGEQIIEPLLLNAHGQARLVIAVLARTAGEGAAPHQRHADAPPVILACIMLRQDDKGILLMAGGPPPGADHRLLMRHRGALGGAFRRMPAIEVHQVEIPRQEIQGGAGGIFQHHIRLTGIADDNAAGDAVPLGQHAVEQRDLHRQARVPQNHPQGLRFLTGGKHGGHAGQAVLALLNGVADVAQVAAADAPHVTRAKGRMAVIAVALAGILQGQHIAADGAVHARIEGIPAEAPVPVLDQIAHIAFAAGAVIGVDQLTMVHHLHLISGVRRVKSQGCSSFVIKDRHGAILPFVILIPQ